ncbi:chemokine XC receptor 1-like isoform X3 [Polyodon spathula]|uniref:chemokine XC receptor 1-like isoform X3 n=1 Tax=Polyodon spathula TaxID=7913 RepID=UPI001B7F1739|nr:chemokine XC receptor 1-like isoform X3 [Polyodon spathula]
MQNQTYFTTVSTITNVVYDETDYSDEGIVFLCEDNSHAVGGVFTSVLFYLVFFLSLIGNGLVLCALVRYEDLKKVTNIFILNLAISDLVFAFSLPFWAFYHSYQWIFGSFMCKLLSGIYFIGFYSCMMFLMVMTIDRYLAVVHAVSTTRIRRTWYACLASAVIWFISIAAAIPEIISTDTVKDIDGNVMCEETIFSEEKKVTLQLLGYYLQIVFFFLLPFVVIVYCYCRILKTVATCRIRRKHKAVKLILTIVVVFFLCWAPYNLIILLMSLKLLEVSPLTDCDVGIILNYSFYICRNIAYFHCCLNPWFYVFAVVKFQRHLASLSRCFFSHYRFREPNLSSLNSAPRSSILSDRP